MKAAETKNYRFLFILGWAFVVGASLRLYMLSSQILVDDEWHSVNAVIGRTFLDVLTQFNPSDNSSLPFNLYNLFLYNSLGWSEFTLRLPAILAGLLSLILLPYLVRKIFNDRVSLVFTCLLAIAPFLIFYSRFSRAYSLMTLLCFSALLFSYQWLTTGKHRYAAGFVVIGAFAVYVHLFSVVVVFVPFVTTFGFGPVSRCNVLSSARSQIIVSFKTTLTLTFILAALLLPLSWPVLLESANLPWAKGKITLDGFITAATLISGTVNFPLNALFGLLCVAGHVILLKQKPLLGWTFLSTTCAYIVVLLVSRPEGIDTGVVLLRYMIVEVPIALTMVALAIDCLLMRAQNMRGIYRIVPILGVGGFLIFLFVAGPLPAIYVSPNNFTNHSAFQGFYKPCTWEYSDARHIYPAFSVKRDQIPQFYHWLRGQLDIKAIIEYPFDICNYNNLLYYYQHFHKKRIIVGYCSDTAFLGYTLEILPSQTHFPFRVGILSADQILSRVADPEKLAFRNMVDVTTVGSVSHSKADIIVLHKYIMALRIMPEGMDTIRVYYRAMGYFGGQFREAFGLPVYEDAQIICFRIKQVKHGGAKQLPNGAPAQK